MIRRVPRRALLRGAIAGGAVAIGLPWLEIMEPAKRVSAATAPKRVVFWFTANGSLPSIWTPPADLSIASAVTRAASQVGQAVGVALILVFVGTGADLGSFRHAWWTLFGCTCAAAALTTALGPPRAATGAVARPGPVT